MAFWALPLHAETSPTMAEHGHNAAAIHAIERIATLEADLDAVRREADESARLATLGLLSATVAHELRNVLTPVLSYAQIALADPCTSGPARKALTRTVEGIATATEILESTLEFGSGRSIRAASAVANVREAIENAMTCLARDPGRDGVSVEIEVAPDLMIAIRPMALQQVFMNLLLNALRALKSSGAGGRKRLGIIRIVATHTAAGDRVRIEMSDNGPGFPAAFAVRMFRPFTSSDSDAPGSKGGGAGLGLAICRRLIEESSGSITASATPGEGATFSIVLPVAASALRKAS